MNNSDSSSDDTVQLSPLKSAISSALPLLPSDKTNEILEQILHAGVEKPADLQFVTAEDLHSLKPIQKRRLLKAWADLDDGKSTCTVCITWYHFTLLRLDAVIQPKGSDKW